MIQDQNITRAVSRVLQRSERQMDLERLVGTFVDVGILPLLHNDNNQILYGRRGTGKTHVLKVLESELGKEGRNTVVYIDARTLGSTAQFSDESIGMRTRCQALFRDVLTPVHNALLEHIIEHPSSRAEEALIASDELSSAIVEPTRFLKEQAVTTSATRETATEANASLAVGTKSSLGGGASAQAKAGHTIESSYRVETEDKVLFPALHDALQRTINLADTSLYILFDEWASLPADIQPYLAEFIKRGVLPIQAATLKIASLEYRSRFHQPKDGGLVGFELGADISTAPELDDYYVFDRNPEQIASLYADMLLRHLSADLKDNYLATVHRVESGDHLASRMFTERATFKELARSAEGVVRDLINIFTQAYFHALRRGRNSIDRVAVLEAARQWFEQDKAQHLDDALQRVLRRIVDEVIGARRARSFLLPRDLERHPMILRLFDARVLHHLQRGYADKDNPGVRYNIYTLDYGTYVDLIGTSKQPDVGFGSEDTEAEVVVPFDDKRSIRRIILNEDVLGVGKA